MNDGAVSATEDLAIGGVSHTACDAGRNAAFTALAECEYSRLRGLAWRFGFHADELDDAVQEILLRAWASWPRFRGESAPATWLTRIAVNYLTSRRHLLMRRLRLFRAMARPAEPVVSSPPSPDVTEAHARAVACVERLSPKLWAVFVLRHIEEMSVAATASVLEVSEEVVRARSHLARRKLRDMLKGQME